MATTASAARSKPMLRGVSHEIAFFVAALAGWELVGAAPSPLARVSAGVYALTLATLFGVSALYHRPIWRPRVRVWFRRLDHSAIFLLIAGTYTPMCLLALGEMGRPLLALAWTGAVLGIAQAMLWVRAPRWVTALLYVLLGWMIVGALGPLVTSVGWGGMGWLGAGGALYTLGAVIYATRRPDPFPRVFGYHEVFHVLVIAAAICHFVVVKSVVLPR